MHAETGMDTKSSQYVDLCKAAIGVVRQVCLQLQLISLQELAELLRCIADAPIDAQFHCELKGIFNQKLSSDPSVHVHRSTLTTVEVSENYLRHVEWAKFMNNRGDVNSKLSQLGKFWTNLGLQRPTEKSAKDIAACEMLTEPDCVIAGPLGVQYLR